MTHDQNNEIPRNNYIKNGQIHSSFANVKNAETDSFTNTVNKTINNENTADGKSGVYKPYGICRRCCTILCLILAATLFTIGLLSLRFTPFDLVMQERLRMTPGLPPYEWWKNPEPELLCTIHIFTVTNPKSFLNGTDSRMKLKECGPIVYRERIVHTDVVFHENSTMSYTIRRFLEFQPDRNEPGILNKTIIVPNVVLLGMAASVAHSFPATIGLRFISGADSVFVNTTVYNYLWNFTTPAFLSAQKLVPFMVAQDNGGAMYNIYKDFENRVNVRIGAKYGYDQFFMMNTFDDRPTVPGLKPENGECYASLQNSTEGALYPFFLTKNSTPTYWRKTVCRPIPLTFEEELDRYSLTVYRYVARENMYDRYKNQTADCYAGVGEVLLPDGLSDVSRCYHGLPVGISAPHFYGRSGYWNESLEGFHPSKEKHGSFALIEPITGVPIQQMARSQSNLVLPELKHLGDEINRFSRVVVPLVWVEYHLEKLTTEIIYTLVFIVNILPVLQYFISVLILIGSGFYLKVGIDRLQLEHKLRHTND